MVAAAAMVAAMVAGDWERRHAQPRSPTCSRFATRESDPRKSALCRRHRRLRLRPSLPRRCRLP
jgi:hypothetical protein